MGLQVRFWGGGGGGEGGKGVVTTSCLLVRMSKLPSEEKNNCDLLRLRSN